jgi:hypothetical protein
MLGDKLALMSEGRIIESGTGRDLFLAPKTEFAARFFGAGQVLPCRIMGEREAGAEVSCPLGILTVPLGSKFNAASPKLFVPNDAVTLQEPGGAGWKPAAAVCAASLFEGSKLSIKLFLPWTEKEPTENSPPEILFEAIVGPRTRPPAPDSALSFWVDQSLLRFVR